ncbi:MULTISPECIES: DUF3349 domain-containing protein [Nocardia]|uniref:DUF3349 domain-containing protein n=1 Tax=Nocardia TaxID=1817 RepID=UPI002455716A|nr:MULTISPECIES: DUF3349 domain-containing protein [Nocardia]
MTEPEANTTASGPSTADPVETVDRAAADRPGMLARILDWLRAGYPQGVPKSDYVALFAVLHRHLTDYEVVMVAEELVRRNPETEITREAIVEAIARFAMEQPDPGDVARVAEHLAAGGWRLEEELAEQAAAEAAEQRQG